MEHSWTVDGPQWFLVQCLGLSSLAVDSRLPEMISLKNLSAELLP